MKQRIDHLQVHPIVSLGERRAAIRARGQRLFDFGVGDPSEPTPDFVREALMGAVPVVSDYPDVSGSPELRAAIAGYLGRRFGLELDAEREILPTAGSKEAIFHLPMVLVDNGSTRDTVVYAEPAYEAFRFGTAFAGAREHAVALHAESRYLFGPEDVGDEVLARTAIVFLNYPHNPSGQDLPPEMFARWVEARERYGFVIVSDECYADLYYGEPPRSILEFGNEGCLAVHSLSKRSGMTGYLSGFIAGDPKLVATLRRFRAGMGGGLPVWTVAAATAAWNDDSHAAARRDLFAEKRRVLLDMLAARGLRAYPGNASLFIWCEVPAGETGDVYTERLFAAGIVAAPGSMFGPGQERWVRIALAPTIEDCRDVADVWPD